MRIGVDVGGTNTDAVLVDGRDVLAEAKTPTTPDVTGGISSSIRALVESSNVAASDVQAVMIGTTHFTNAVVEARRLAPTGVIRLGLPATEALPPMVGWPTLLRDAGNVTVETTFFVEPDGELTFVSQSVSSEKGPHPDLDSGFEAFCNVIGPALA